ncbi:hypothetical protein D3C85_1739430 [compost metagenome]
MQHQCSIQRFDRYDIRLFAPQHIQEILGDRDALSWCNRLQAFTDTRKRSHKRRNLCLQLHCLYFIGFTAHIIGGFIV